MGASVAETETGGVFGNAQDATIVTCIGLRALAHKQPAIPIKIDNSTCNSFVHSNLKHTPTSTQNLGRALELAPP